MNPRLWGRCATCGLTAIGLMLAGCQGLNTQAAPANDPFFSIRDQTPTTGSQSADEDLSEQEDPLTN